MMFVIARIHRILHAILFVLFVLFNMNGIENFIIIYLLVIFTDGG
jgi:hypothetical protein